jgi:hypothetical protein
MGATELVADTEVRSIDPNAGVTAPVWKKGGVIYSASFVLAQNRNQKREELPSGTERRVIATVFESQNRRAR